MVRSRTNSNSSNYNSYNNNMIQPSNGGIMGSGVFGNFGTFINCNADSDSTYCKFMKIFNIFMIFLLVCFIIYMVYIFFFSNKK